MNRFISERKGNWQRLEELLAKIESVAGLRGLPRTEVRELGELYRRAATDLAIARAETRDPKLINYLNSLVTRAHGRIYRAEGQGAGIIRNFFYKDFPQTFRETLGFSAFSFFVFTAFGVVSFILCYADTNFSDALGLSGVAASAQSNNQWWLTLNESNPEGASEILANNILVSLRAFALGAFFGIGAVYVLAYNGAFIGGVLGVCYKVSPAFGTSLVTFMVGHGVIELSCIFIAGGAGIVIGYSIINPGDMSRVDALKTSGLKAVRLAIGCACLLVIAGIIEGFLSPASLPPWVKYATGISTGLVMFSYLFLVGRTDDREAGESRY